MGYIYDRDTDDMVWTDEGDQPLSPMEQAIQDGTQDELLRASDEYYGNPGAGSPVDTAGHPDTNWFDPESYNWLVNTPGGPMAPTDLTDPAPPSPAPNPAPTPTSNTGGGGTSSGGGSTWTGGGAPIGGYDVQSLLAPYPGAFNKPDIDAAVRGAVGRLPQLEGFQAPAMPQIQPWQAPSWEQFTTSDPGFEGRRKVGEQSVLNANAAKGLSRSGPALKELINYNSDFAGRNYGDYFGRELQGYQTNVGNQFAGWDRDFEGRKAEYEPKVLKYTTEAGVGERAGNTAFDQSWKQYLADVDIWRDQRDSSFDKLKWQSEFGLDAATR